MREGVQLASAAFAEARERLDAAKQLAAPHVARIDTAQGELRRAERVAKTARMKDRLERLTFEPATRGVEPPARGVERGLGIER